MTSYIPLRIDVTEDLPPDVTAGTVIEIAAWVFPATGETAGHAPCVIALLNGGSYDKRYFHFEVPGRSGYSVAEALAARGHVVILLDHLGVGESARSPNQMAVTRQVAAMANHAAVNEIFARLQSGTLAAAIPAMPRFLKIGGGHSMGGFQTITQQAEHASYDRLLILGYTAIGVQFSVDGRLMSADPGPLDFSQPDYRLADRTMLRAGFHWDDVPDEVIAVDDSLLVEVPYVLSHQSVTAGIVSADAGKITVPVYICLGERDVSPSPHDEPGCYTSSPDITLHILPRCGHCQSFAGTRMEMIDRIDGWLRSI